MRGPRETQSRAIPVGPPSRAAHQPSVPRVDRGTITAFGGSPGTKSVRGAVYDGYNQSAHFTVSKERERFDALIFVAESHASSLPAGARPP